ncbi:acyl-CoA dehydrogenase [Frankia sp. CcI6]|nr:acyl-CoA dehydrogenase [Frankia sp. CcI6]
MDMAWKSSQLKLRGNFFDFGKSAVAISSQARDRDSSFDRALWGELARSRFWHVAVPTELGGDGGDLADYMAALEGLTLGSNDPGFLVSVGAHGAVIQLLLRYGTPEQQRRYLPGLMAGQVGATAATEPTGGSHVAAVRTTARPVADGQYELSGHKCHITNAPEADVVVIVGRVAGVGKRDITLFLIERGQPGVEFGVNEDLIGLRTSPLGPIRMRDASVDTESVLGGVGGGMAILHWCLALDRLSFGIIAAAHMESLLPVALDRANTREAFGTTISEHQYIQDKLVRTKVAVEASRALSYVTLDALRCQDPRAGTLSSCTKLLSAQGIVEAGLEIVQLFGHLGCDREVGIERHLRDAAAFRIAGGTDEMQKKNIFSQLGREYGDNWLRAGSEV